MPRMVVSSETARSTGLPLNARKGSARNEQAHPGHGSKTRSAKPIYIANGTTAQRKSNGNPGLPFAAKLPRKDDEMLAAEISSPVAERRSLMALRWLSVLLTASLQRRVPI